jgi:molybdate/tungstate transport system ATP-binding protein
VRREIRRELRALQRRLRMTVLHVTHDLDEARELADQLGVLGDGTLVQLGSPAEVWRRPASPMVAALVGTENLVPGEIRADADGGSVPFAARLRAGEVEIRGLATREGSGYAAIRGEEITVSLEAVRSSALNQLAGIVTGVAVDGPLARVTIDAGVSLVAVITKRSALALELAPGQRVYAQFKATAVHLI